MEKWAKYFLSICDAVSQNSPCFSRKIGAILVKNKSIIATGYNGPPRGVTHCGSDRIKDDPILFNLMREQYNKVPAITEDHCPRMVLGFSTGGGLHLCPAAHAETNCISDAARRGVCVEGSTLMLNTQPPCMECSKVLINAGIVGVVCSTSSPYDSMSEWLRFEAKMRVETFEELEYSP
uniref:Putative CMP/dCMP deaminase zinc-binding n=1 Tax=viral metagenome TaxID=1070528 RepID=A0A6M3JA11_9ZZZZ